MRRTIAVLAAAGTVAGLMLAAATAAQATPPPPFTCPTQSVCNFQHGDYTGFEETISNTPANRDKWLATAYNGSRNNTTGSMVSVWDSGTDALVACIAPHTRETSDGGNFVYIQYGDTTGCSPPPGP